jgi:hypothetical protein
VRRAPLLLVAGREVDARRRRWQQHPCDDDDAPRDGGRQEEEELMAGGRAVAVESRGRTSARLISFCQKRWKI